MQLDAATGLYHDGARWYNSSLGTFISTDPAQSTANLYCYCGNDPTDATDPTGMALNTPASGASWSAPSNPCYDTSGSAGMALSGSGGNASTYSNTTPAYSSPTWAQQLQQSNEWHERFLASGLLKPLPPIPLPPDNSQPSISADTRSERDKYISVLDAQSNNPSLPLSTRNAAINELDAIRFADYMAQHPWLAMGVPRLVDPSNPGLGGMSGYEQLAISVLSLASNIRGLCQSNANAPARRATQAERIGRNGFGNSVQTQMYHPQTAVGYNKKLTRLDVARERIFGFLPEVTWRTAAVSTPRTASAMISAICKMSICISFSTSTKVISNDLGSA